MTLIAHQKDGFHVDTDIFILLLYIIMFGVAFVLSKHTKHLWFIIFPILSGMFALGIPFTTFIPSILNGFWLIFTLVDWVLNVYKKYTHH